MGQLPLASIQPRDARERLTRIRGKMQDERARWDQPVDGREIAYALFVAAVCCGLVALSLTM